MSARQIRGRDSIACCAGLLLILAFAGAVSAEAAWVKDELRLNLRSGPGV